MRYGNQEIVNEKDLIEAVNQVWRDRQVARLSQNESQYWALVCERERREEMSVSLPDEEADHDAYNPQGGDLRQVVERQIRERRGQQQFRDALRERYGGRCLVTACTVLAVLEAAHIHSYRGERDNRPDNGLLLRADIHTLFDLHLLGIEPDHFQVELHPSLAKEYGHIAGKELGCSPGHRPSRESLKEHYKVFRRKLSEDK